MTLSEFRRDLWRQKTRFPGQSCGVVCVILRLVVLVQYQLPIFLLLTPLRLSSCSSDSKTNLPKYTTLQLTPVTLLEILDLSLTNILPSLTKLHLSPKPVTITFVSFAVSGLTWIRQLPVLLLPLSFTPNLITVILSTINSSSLNYPIFCLYRFFSELLVFLVFFRFCAVH